MKNILFLSAFFFLTSCMAGGQKAEVSFSDVEVLHTPDFDTTFAIYCKTQPDQENMERMAIFGSFFGDYKKIVNEIPAGSSDIKKGGPSEYKILPAKDFITEKAKDYHFLLINEAHHSQQNRAFTTELLEPLRKAGYRYLALEALNNEDSLITENGYPLLKTGYYFKDPVFGNMVRRALALGYTLVPYETKIKPDGTYKDGSARDRDQAENIFNKTWHQDTVGKVLVHAGYSHISETGGTQYMPMGAQLKSLARQEILTVDQQKMTEGGIYQNPLLTGSEYLKVLNSYDLVNPAVLVKPDGQSKVDFVSSFGIDIQVFHPVTQYIQERPDWQITEGSELVAIPDKWKEEYKDYLIAAIPKGEPDGAVPVDQFIIDHEKALILQKGEYTINLTDCNGSLRGKAELTVK